MKTQPLDRTHAIRAAVTSSAVRWIFIDAAIGAASGGLFGIVFGAFGLLLAAESWSIVSVAGYFAVCGAGAGAIVGVCRAVLDGESAAEQTSHFPFSTSTSGSNFRRITPVATAVDDSTSPSDQVSRGLPRNRLSAMNRRSQSARESINPSRN